jgi:hypothetical protein
LTAIGWQQKNFVFLPEAINVALIVKPVYLLDTVSVRKNVCMGQDTYITGIKKFLLP